MKKHQEGAQSLEQLLNEANASRVSRPHASGELASRALQLARRRRDSAGIAAALRALGLARLVCGRPRDAIGALQKGAELSRRLDDPRSLASCLAGLGIALSELGDFAGAVSHFEKFLEVAPEEDRRSAVERTAIGVGILHEGLQDFGASMSIYNSALAWGRKLGRTQPVIEQNAAIAALLLGKDRVAERHFQRAVRSYGDSLFRVEQLNLTVHIAAILVERGKVDRARSMLEGAREAAHAVYADRISTATDIAIGRLHLASGEAGVAEHAFKAALQRARSAGEVFHEISALQGLAKAQAASEHTDDAYRSLSAAQLLEATVLARCGAMDVRRRIYLLHERLVSFMESDEPGTPDGAEVTGHRGSRVVAEARSALGRRKGHRVHRELTPRELEVLRQIVAGGTNKQIAARLRVSPFTVRFHVSAVLAKLGARTRAEAIVRALGEGLVADDAAAETPRRR